MSVLYHGLLSSLLWWARPANSIMSPTAASESTELWFWPVYSTDALNQVDQVHISI